MRKHIVVPGDRFGRLTVIKEIYKQSPHYRKKEMLINKRYALCKCECGELYEVYLHNLVKGKTKTCTQCRFWIKDKNAREDLTGKKYNSITVLGIAKGIKKGRRQGWHCRCDCGENSIRSSDDLKRRSWSCGHCLANSMVGRKYGRLMVVKSMPPKKRLTQILCRCDCGNEKQLAATFVHRGKIKSCGCLLKEQKLENSPKAKLKNLEVLAIRELNKNNPIYTPKDLAKIFNVTKATIDSILTGKNWKSLKG